MKNGEHLRKGYLGKILIPLLGNVSRAQAEGGCGDSTAARVRG